jgi:hypothetical protein
VRVTLLPVILHESLLSYHGQVDGHDRYDCNVYPASEGWCSFCPACFRAFSPFFGWYRAP